jgi:acetyl esterase/lipase
LTKVESSSIAVFPAPGGDSPAPAVLVCPGGGYSILAYDLEGTEIAQWLNSIGFTAVVLKYRVPDNRAGALEDAQRTLSLMRHNATAWNIDPEHIGILGFSAGGHLAACTSAATGGRAYIAVDDADQQRCTPDFTVLVYPAYLSDEHFSLPVEVAVSRETPPAFIVQTQDDKHYIDSSLAYYIALKSADVPAELHLFPEGGHGYGLRPSKHGVSGWPALCGAWLARVAKSGFAP